MSSFRPAPRPGHAHHGTLILLYHKFLLKMGEREKWGRIDWGKEGSRGVWGISSAGRRRTCEWKVRSGLPVVSDVPFMSIGPGRRSAACRRRINPDRRHVAVESL